MTHSSKFKIALVFLAFVASSSFAQQIRVEVIDNIFRCKSTVVYNNSNNYVRGGVIDWEYTYSDGSSNRGSTQVAQIAPGQSHEVATYHASDMQQCPRLRYNMRVLNWRTY